MNNYNKVLIGFRSGWIECVKDVIAENLFSESWDHKICSETENIDENYVLNYPSNRLYIENLSTISKKNAFQFHKKLLNKLESYIIFTNVYNSPVGGNQLYVGNQALFNSNLVLYINNNGDITIIKDRYGEFKIKNIKEILREELINEILENNV
jgi:hypothetical protein